MRVLLPPRVVDMIHVAYKTSVIKYTPLNVLFDDAMASFAIEKGSDTLSIGTRNLFQWAAERGHKEARWISDTLEQSNGDLKVIISSFTASNNEKAHYFVWLCNGNIKSLIRSASSGWSIPYGRLLSLIPPSGWDHCLEWIIRYGDRNTCWDLLEKCGRSLDLYDTRFHNLTNVIRSHPAHLARCGDFVNHSWARTFRTMRLKSHAPKCLARRIVNDLHILVSFSRFHKAAVYEFGSGIVVSGFGCQYVCDVLDTQLKQHFSHSGLNAVDIMTTALDLVSHTQRKKLQAIKVTLIVCKLYGLSRPLRMYIGRFINRKIMACYWVEHFEEWLSTKSWKQIKI